MKRIEYRTRDKTTWGEGPWQSEPDKMQWEDEATKMPCLIVRGSSGALCGYVGVGPGHQFFGKDYDDLPSVEVHGGLTFAASCSHGDETASVCHRTEENEPDSVWWFGFDCAHSGDYMPESNAYLPEHLKDRLGAPAGWGNAVIIYRDMAYVTREVESLAKQLSAMERGL